MNSSDISLTMTFNYKVIDEEGVSTEYESSHSFSNLFEVSSGIKYDELPLSDPDFDSREDPSYFKEILLMFNRQNPTLYTSILERQRKLTKMHSTKSRKIHFSGEEETPGGNEASTQPVNIERSLVGGRIIDIGAIFRYSSLGQFKERFMPMVEKAYSNMDPRDLDEVMHNIFNKNWQKRLENLLQKYEAYKKEFASSSVTIKVTINPSTRFMGYDNNSMVCVKKIPEPLSSIDFDTRMTKFRDMIWNEIKRIVPQIAKNIMNNIFRELRMSSETRDTHAMIKDYQEIEYSLLRSECGEVRPDMSHTMCENTLKTFFRLRAKLEKVLGIVQADSPFSSYLTIQKDESFLGASPGASIQPKIVSKLPKNNLFEPIRHRDGNSEERARNKDTKDLQEKILRFNRKLEQIIFMDTFFIEFEADFNNTEKRPRDFHDICVHHRERMIDFVCDLYIESYKIMDNIL